MESRHPTCHVSQGEVVQFLCRDSLDIGEAARALRANGLPSLDLSVSHLLTGPVEVEGADPGDVLVVEILDVNPLVDFGYAIVHPDFGLRPDILAPFHQFTEASQLGDRLGPSKVPFQQINRSIAEPRS